MAEESQTKIASSDQRVAFYIPDRNPNTVDLVNQAKWVKIVSDHFSKKFGGATSLDYKGYWLDEETQRVTVEDTRYVYSYTFKNLDIAERDFFIGLAAKFGYETQQDAVLVEILGQTYLIHNSDYRSFIESVEST